MSQLRYPRDDGIEVELVGEIARTNSPGGATDTKKAALPKEATCPAELAAESRNRLYLLVAASNLPVSRDVNR
jgi:hypothetical protein